MSVPLPTLQLPAIPPPASSPAVYLSREMCSDCGIDGPLCRYCGTDCGGSCNDPDSCITCFWDRPDGEFEDEEYDMMEICLVNRCQCGCHENDFLDLGMRIEAGVLWKEEDNPPYVRNGVFPFLRLPGEIREKIYGFAFLQNGKQRRSRNHRGFIHTALLRTCRQINKEACHLPLILNRPSFSNPTYALAFLGFELAPTVRHFVTGLHLEYSIHGDFYLGFSVLIPRLVAMKVTHLGLTVMGRYSKEAILGHACFTNRFTALKDLKSIDLILTSALMTDKEKQECVEFVKGKLLRGPVVESGEKPNEKNSKRPVTPDSEQGNRDKPTKKIKQAKLESVPKKRSERERRLRSQGAKRIAEAVSLDTAKAGLLIKYDQLKQYAESIGVRLVNIRLAKAHEAAKDGEIEKFEAVAQGIWTTLEEHYININSARTNLLTPSFASSSTLQANRAASIKTAGDSQGSSAQTESQQSMVSIKTVESL